jgi:CDP-4-dehydro-6-deoxyglucose reductase
MAWWRAKHRRFDFRVTYTGADPPEGAKFTGRIPDMLGDAFKDLSGHSIFIAGSPDFVDASADAARSLGATDEQIFVERYHPQSPAVTASADRLA